MGVLARRGVAIFCGICLHRVTRACRVTRESQFKLHDLFANWCIRESRRGRGKPLHPATAPQNLVFTGDVQKLHTCRQVSGQTAAIQNFHNRVCRSMRFNSRILRFKRMCCMIKPRTSVLKIEGVVHSI
jgi:hypothetical protein